MYIGGLQMLCDDDDDDDDEQLCAYVQTAVWIRLKLQTLSVCHRLTICRYTILEFNQAIQAYSAWPSLRG